jgi:hypothetical protein
MGGGADQHMLVPLAEFSDFLMVQPQFGLCFFKALFLGAAQSAEPNKEIQPVLCGEHC